MHANINFSTQYCIFHNTYKAYSAPPDVVHVFDVLPSCIQCLDGPHIPANQLPNFVHSQVHIDDNTWAVGVAQPRRGVVGYFCRLTGQCRGRRQLFVLLAVVQL